eukprot:119830_1
MTLLNSVHIALLIQDIFVAIALILVICISVYHVYKIKEITQLKIAMEWITIVYLIIIISYLAVYGSIIYDLYPSSFGCTPQQKLSAVFGVSTKVFIYFVLSERLFFIFKGTSFAFSYRTISLTRVSITLWSIYLCIHVAIFAEGYLSHHNYCSTIFPWYAPIPIAVMDIVFFMTTIITYSRRFQCLNLVYAEHNITARSDSNSSSSSSSHVESLLKVARKSTILGVAAMVSTQQFLFTFTFFGVAGLWTAVDSVINVLCITLMFARHGTIYTCCCSWLSNHISDGCLECCSCHCCVKVFPETEETTVDDKRTTVTQS